MSPAPPADALATARMLGVDRRLGGMLLRGGGGGAARDSLIATLAGLLEPGTRPRRLPVNVTDEQLDGGIDIAAALAGRGAARRPGLLDQAGLLVVPMAGRLEARIAARIATALDRGDLVVVALDDGDGAPPAVLVERLAFHLDLDTDLVAPDEGVEPVDDAAAAAVVAATAAALGVASSRADLFALRAARAIAALDGRAGLRADDLVAAMRLVLMPRATRMPAPPEPAEPPSREPETGRRDEGDGDGGGEARALADRVLAAVQAEIDPDLLAALDAGHGRHGEASRTRGPGERRRARERGRVIGTRAGDPRNGGRLALVATLRNAAPWQRLRGRTDRVLVRPSDLRVHRREARAELVAIFAVDASGSAAMARLAEAKGAVELLLGQAYVQRAEVALTAFGGAGAALLLPPTRSLTRARRALGDLPGGGGTPLASGIDSALDVARAARAKGRTPMVVVLSDGRANIGAGGVSAGRAAAERDAIAAARAVKAERVAAIFIDTGARPRAEGERIAAAMGARYLPLPYAGAAAVKAAVNAFAPRGR